MNTFISLSATGNPFQIHKVDNFENNSEFESPILKKVEACKTLKSAADLLKGFPANCTEFDNIRFIKNIENIQDNNYEPWSVKEMNEQALEYLTIQEKEEKEVFCKKKLFQEKCDIGINSCAKIANLWTVTKTNKAEKLEEKLPDDVQEALKALIKNLEQMDFNNDVRFIPIPLNQTSRIPKDSFHCRLKEGHTVYVACWNTFKKQRKVSLYYAGTHEQAPYK